MLSSNEFVLKTVALIHYTIKQDEANNNNTITNNIHFDQFDGKIPLKRSLR